MGKWILAFLIAAAVLFLCWKLRGVMLTPVCRGKGQSLELILRAVSYTRLTLPTIA